MKINLLTAFSIAVSLSGQLSAQFTSGFENFPIDSSAGYYAGSANSDGFEDNGLFFRNDYNAAFQYWNGFALSQKTDSLTAGFSNQFSCRAGRAFEGSTFTLAYASGRIFIRRQEAEAPRKFLRFRLCNNTYAARSMEFGDAFAKKFGGASGQDPDYFRLRIFNYLNGSITDSASFYLADFRAAESQNDYILKDWIMAETSFSNPFDSLGFELESSDVGAFGMNTPAYFCMDNLETESISSVTEFSKKELRLYPNPARDMAILSTDQPGAWKIMDLQGKLMKAGLAETGENRINLTELPEGIFLFQIKSGYSKRLQIIR